MKLTLGSLAGLLAGLAGAAIWAAAAHSTGWEMGYLAWAIGLVVGVVVQRSAEARTPASRGLVAAVIALVAIFGGKLAASVLLAERAAAGEVQAADEDLLSLEDPERVISYLADEVVLRHLERGEEIDWPEGTDSLYADEEADYPAELWSEAAALWDAMGGDAHQRYIDDIRASSARVRPEFAASSAWETFRKSFGPMDLLFFALALITAFKAGAGKLA